jgi:hypothetical protein
MRAKEALLINGSETMREDTSHYCRKVSPEKSHRDRGKRHSEEDGGIKFMGETKRK